MRPTPELTETPISNIPRGHHFTLDLPSGGGGVVFCTRVDNHGADQSLIWYLGTDHKTLTAQPTRLVFHAALPISLWRVGDRNGLTHAFANNGTWWIHAGCFFGPRVKFLQKLRLRMCSARTQYSGRSQRRMFETLARQRHLVAILDRHFRDHLSPLPPRYKP